jgi:hypothetical protein
LQVRNFVMITPQIASPQIFRLITLSQNRINHENRLGERLQTRTCQANRPPITILPVAWQRLCRTHARIRRQVQRWHIRQTRQTRTLPSAGIHAVGSRLPISNPTQPHNPTSGDRLLADLRNRGLLLL